MFPFKEFLCEKDNSYTSAAFVPYSLHGGTDGGRTNTKPRCCSNSFTESHSVAYTKSNANTYSYFNANSNSVAGADESS